MGDKLQAYIKVNGIMRRHFEKKITKETQLRIHNIQIKRPWNLVMKPEC
jgi:hypothetical protein